MNLIRKLKINNLIPIEFTQDEQKILSTIDKIFDNLIPFKCSQYPKSILYFNEEGMCIFDLYQDNYSSILFIKQKGFYDELNNSFTLIKADDFDTIFCRKCHKYFDKPNKPLTSITPWYGHRILFLEQQYKLHQNKTI